MNLLFYNLLLVYSLFLFLGLLIQIKLIQAKKEVKSGWKKFVFFNLIMFCLFAVFHFITNSITIIFIGIALAGLLEIIKATQKNKTTIRILFSTFYLLLFLLFIRASVTFDSYFLIETLAIVAVFDGFSQLGGKGIGKTSLAPKISPNKTIEGSLVGFFITVLFGLSLIAIGNPTHLGYILLLPILALTGDLLASRIKRISNIKDFSKLIPYQGGILDRFDSYVFSVSVIMAINL